MSMLKQGDFENIVWDFLFTYRQFLLNGRMHQRVTTEAYRSNLATWNALLLSLESGTLLGLAKLLEREDDLGRLFNNETLDSIRGKILNLRHAYIAHNDLSKMRNMGSLLERNMLYGGDMIRMIDAIRNRLLSYQKSLDSELNVDQLFRWTTTNADADVDSWLKSFDKPL